MFILDKQSKRLVGYYKRISNFLFLIASSLTFAMRQILLGPAGSPEKSTLEGIAAIRKLGLQSMEVQFTHGIKMGGDLAKEIGKVQEKENITLSVHAPYYINLSSENRQKVAESRQRILRSCELGHYMHASPVVFHPGFYGKHSGEETYDAVRNEIDEMLKIIKNNKWNVELAPEVMGRTSQFGSFEETIALAKELKCSICVDICHIYARNQGRIDFDYIFSEIGKLERSHIHFHFSGVEFGPTGEKRHLVLNGKPDFKQFGGTLLASKLGATIICESPVTWEDSLKMKKTLERLGYKF